MSAYLIKTALSARASLLLGVPAVAALLAMVRASGTARVNEKIDATTRAGLYGGALGSAGAYGGYRLGSALGGKLSAPLGGPASRLGGPLTTLSAALGTYLLGREGSNLGADIAAW